MLICGSMTHFEVEFDSESPYLQFFEFQKRVVFNLQVGLSQKCSEMCSFVKFERTVRTPFW